MKNYKLNDLIVNQARTWLGTKYHHQGRLKKSATCLGGVDCVGVLIGIINELNLCDENGKLLSSYDYRCYTINPDTKLLLNLLDQHLTQVEIDKIIPGDVLLFKLWHEPQHIGIATEIMQENYIKLGFIHCNSTSGFVVEQPLSNAWKRMITYAYRFKSA